MRARAIVRPLLTTVLLAALPATALSCGSSDGSSSSSPRAGVNMSGGSGFAGAALPAGVAAADFTLTDQMGQRVSLRSYRGHVVVVAFLYSTCGSTCVVIAQQIRGALDELPHPVPVLLVSANPRADTPVNIKRFLTRVSLTGRVRYLTGSTAALEPIWRAYGVTPASGGRAAFDRAATVYLLDRNGDKRVVYQLEQLTPEALSHDIRKLS